MNEFFCSKKPKLRFPMFKKAKFKNSFQCLKKQNFRFLMYKKGKNSEFNSNV